MPGTRSRATRLRSTSGPPDNPIAGGMNLLGYDAMTLGNHEFNFGPATFATMLGQVDFPLLGTINLDDDGSYGFINDNVQDYINLEVNGKKVTIFGLTNPRVYRYELPTNIPGLTFYSGPDRGLRQCPQIMAAEAPTYWSGSPIWVTRRTEMRSTAMCCSQKGGRHRRDHRRAQPHAPRTRP